MKASLLPLLAAAACSLLCKPLCLGQAYSWSTIAGTPGRSGSVDGTNSGALFYNPTGLAIDHQGSLYVAEDLNHSIRKLTPSGGDWVVSTIAGLPRTNGSADGTNSAARFNRPRGIALESSGVLFVADYFNSTLRRIERADTNWNVTTVAGYPGVLASDDGVGTNAFFRRLTGVAVAPSGKVYVADMLNNTIRQVEPSGADWVVTTIAGTAGWAGWADGIGPDAEFASPYSLVMENDAKIYVSDWGNNAVRQLALTVSGWQSSTIAGVANAPSGSADGVGSAAQFYQPNGIARDASGTLFVADQYNHTIRMLTPTNGSWMVTTIGGSPMQAGTNDGPGVQARFQRPWGVAVDSAGAVYVADYSNHTIRRGVQSTVEISPPLAVSFVTNQVVISWPLAASGFLLERAARLEEGTTWNEITEGVNSTPDGYVLIAPADETSAFYRLRRR